MKSVANKEMKNKVEIKYSKLIFFILKYLKLNCKPWHYSCRGAGVFCLLTDAVSLGSSSFVSWLISKFNSWIGGRVLLNIRGGGVLNLLISVIIIIVLGLGGLSGFLGSSFSTGTGLGDGVWCIFELEISRGVLLKIRGGVILNVWGWIFLKIGWGILLKGGVRAGLGILLVEGSSSIGWDISGNKSEKSNKSKSVFHFYLKL